MCPRRAKCIVVRLPIVRVRPASRGLGTFPPRLRMHAAARATAFWRAGGAAAALSSRVGLPGAVHVSRVAARTSSTLTDRAAAADARLRAEYDAPIRVSTSETDAVTAYRKRLQYRSRQRGWLEVDLLLGSWADKHLGALPADQLKSYDAILQLETVDLYNVLTGKEAIPAAVDTPLFRAIVAYAAAAPLGKASKEVRGGKQLLAECAPRRARSRRRPAGLRRRQARHEQLTRGAAPA